MKSALFSLAACLLPALITAQDSNPIWDSSQKPSGWYFVRFNVPQGEQLTSLTGGFKVPHLNPVPPGGTYYIWPGLETSDFQGIYQNVLSGTETGTWTYFSGYCCETGISWEDPQNVYEGQELWFSNVDSGTTWTTIQTIADTGDAETGNWDALAGKDFQSAVFAIELYNLNWDFGPITFDNVQIKTTGSDASWCNASPENWNGATDFSINGLTSTVDDSGVTCNIESIVLNQPLTNYSPKIRGRSPPPPPPHR